MSWGLMFLLGTATIDETIDVGACGVVAEVMGLDVTKTVIWLGEMVLDEAGICMTECTLVTGLGLGLGFRTKLAGFTPELELELVLTVKAELF